MFAVAAAVTHAVESALVASGRIPWPGGSRAWIGGLEILIVGLVGAAGGASAARWRHGPAVAAATGAISVILDLGAPDVVLRMIPGLLLLVSGGLGATALADGSLRRGLEQLTAWIFLTIHALLILPILTLGLVAPVPFILLLVALWTVGLVLGVQASRDRPLLVPIAPLVLAVIAAAALFLADAFLGWGP